MSKSTIEPIKNPTPPPSPGGLGEKIGATARYVLESTVEAVGETLASIIENGLRGLLETLENEAKDVFTPGLDYLLNLPGLPESQRDFILSLKAPAHPIQIAPLMILGIIGTIGSIFGAFGPVSRLGEYAVDIKLQSGRLSPETAAMAVVQGHLEQGAAEIESLDSGFSTDRFKTLLNLAGEPPGLQTILELWNRKIIDEATADQAIRESRLKMKYTDPVKQLRFGVPSISDMVRFAVRDAYNPGIVSQYALGDEYPGLLTTEAEKIGISEEDTHYYWYSHWEMPSVSQAFEMLHRGIIGTKDVETLLRVADYAPTWRDKMMAISYNPYTRVDVRRMYKAGVLSIAEVKKAYLEIGYDDAHAQKLAEWTTKEAHQEEKDLAKGELLDAYKKHVIDRGTLTSSLTDLGYAADAIGILVSIAEYQKKKEKKAPEKSLVRADMVRAYSDGLFTRDETHTGLRELGYDDKETDLILKLADTQITKKNQAGNRELAKGELIGAYERGLIKKEEAATALGDLGYDPEESAFLIMLSDFKTAQHQTDEELDVIHQLYINRYIDRPKLLEKLGLANLPAKTSERLTYLWEIERDRRMARPTAGNLAAFLKAGIIDVDRYGSEMLGLGYTEEYVDWFVASLTKKPAPAKPKEKVV